MEAYPLRAENIPSFPLLPVSQIHLLNDADLGKCYSELLSLVQANDFSPEELSLQQVRCRIQYVLNQVLKILVYRKAIGVCM